MSKIRIALVGNMNNNNFSMLRYLHKLGFNNTYLLLYRDELDHFHPEADTYEYEYWKKYIIQTPIYNGNILKYLFSLSKSELKKVYEGYDYYIGSGFAPALFYKAGLKLDMFIPYSVGVEFIFNFNFKFRFKTAIRSRTAFFNSIYCYFQMKGIVNNVRYTVSMDRDCIWTLSHLGVKNYKLPIPILYNLETIKTDKNDDKLSKLIDQISSAKFVVYSHVSHLYYDAPPLLDIKKNYITIESFASFIKKHNINDAILVLHEYGTDQGRSKELINKLRIAEKVKWMPVLKRKEILKLLSYAHVGVSEFGSIMWGGVGYEFLCKGVPMVHYFNKDEKAFKEEFGMERPFFFDSDQPEEISEFFFDVYKNPLKYEGIKSSLISWYDKHCGLECAKSYTDLINETLNESERKH